MQYRTLGKTGFNISDVSLGTWQVGGKWGAPFSFDNAEKILHAAVDNGINFIDTADVYGDGNGESERAVGQFIRSRSERIYVATKCGRRLNPHNNTTYTPQALRAYVEDSLKNMGIECIDLIQLHCPPTEVYDRPEIFEEFDKLKAEGKILNMGVSVEKIEEAMKAIEYPNVTTVQIIFNIFRQRPAELFFKAAQKKNVGIIVRVPLASGLLSGKFSASTTFGPGDHRHYNRQGTAFDKGETFSGVDYDLGLQAVEEIKKIFPNDALALIALKWTLMFDAVSCVIPGASRMEQVLDNVKASELTTLSPTQMNQLSEIYQQYIKNEVHHLW